MTEIDPAITKMSRADVMGARCRSGQQTDGQGYHYRRCTDGGRYSESGSAPRRVATMKTGKSDRGTVTPTTPWWRS